MFIFREGKGGRKTGREKHQCVVASCTPPTGDLAHNPGMSPRLGIEPATLWFTGWHSVHWATAAKANIFNFITFRERRRKGEREGNIYVREKDWLVALLMHPNHACSLTGISTGNLLACGKMPNQLSHTSQDCLFNFWVITHYYHLLWWSAFLNLAMGSPFKLVSVSLWHIPICFELFVFRHHRMFQADL